MSKSVKVAGLVAGVIATMGVTQSVSAAESVTCSGTAAKKPINGGSGTTTQTTFFKGGFDFQCSNNVLLSHDEYSTNMLLVAAGSLKGNQVFAGNSNGGAIKAVGKCTGTNDACQATDVSTALTNASSL